jgi:predicted RNA-binding Zn-ribbon protein involved in translation (DUF1610 family)
MAFCPNCGKQVTEQASKCISCGKDLDPKAKAARFKGTMMMSPAAGPAVAAPAGGNAKAPEAPKPAPAPVAAVAPAPKAPTPGPSKVMKATMLGTGGAGLAPPPAKARAVTTPNAPAQAAPPPAAGAAAAAPAASAQRAPTEVERSVTKPGAPAPVNAPFADEATDPEDSQRFLVGDPMAPAHPAARATSRGERDSAQDELPVRRTGQLLALGLGGLMVIAVVGYLAARFMGLVN